MAVPAARCVPAREGRAALNCTPARRTVDSTVTTVRNPGLERASVWLLKATTVCTMGSFIATVKHSSPAVNTTALALMGRSAVCPAATWTCCFLVLTASSPGKFRFRENAVKSGSVIPRGKQQALLWLTTEWSACSKSCGMGSSTRVSNQNHRCEMVKQSRLCMVRPCQREDGGHSPAKKGKRCLKIKKSLKSIHYEFKNCTSVKAYKPRFCGVCTDGRCCTPHSTKTVQVEFRCPQGKIRKRSMMLINTCACHRNCPQDNAIYQMLDPVFDGLKI
ncbi:CCN family member 3 isoform X3 [Rhinatrema bivittatum]|uniref:CCN family member 3 isoform X3 n=1 Tax=Rhinatrema bivittatum TaxID=194408 RepID=UPI00112BB620|nr:CCN family member 3 isoform X3 [Rhinatrema bivittatum]